MDKNTTKKRETLIWFLVGIVVLTAMIFSFKIFYVPVVYQYEKIDDLVVIVVKPEEKSIHIETPVSVKGVYMTQCTAGEKNLRKRLVDLINKTELNTLVIDVKDYSGGLAWKSNNPILADKVSKICTVSDFPEFLEELYELGIYTIARVTVFQDPLMALLNPDIAVKFASATTTNWKDRKGISYIDPGSEEMWRYITEVAQESYDMGFDEINFDYVRFPSDGNMGDIFYPVSNDFLKENPERGKTQVMKNFFSYLGNEMRKRRIPMSVDFFGMTTTNTDDLNIGQVLEDVLPFTDFVMPMVYPSHYPKGFIGLENPAANPYEVIKYAMDGAFRRASSTPWKIRPWLQDFDLGAVYTVDMVRAQIQAVYDAGFESWILWDASNRYTPSALEENSGDLTTSY